MTLVAGDDRGVGLACAEALRAQGAVVHVADYRSDPLLDITDAAAVTGFVEALPSCPQVAVNVVGNAGPILIVDHDADEFLRILDIELLGAHNFIQAVARRMIRESTPGVIISILSENEQCPGRDLTGHGSAKAPLAVLTRVAAVEFGAYGIRVNAVVAEGTETPSAGVAFLASDEACWITGRALQADGGQDLAQAPGLLDTTALGGAVLPKAAGQ
jgi:NAD(P)-dependent dehydrogenase (short-subunit alcohol dehydrogenase family)